MKNNIFTTLLGYRHEYTQSNEPWLLDDAADIHASAKRTALGMPGIGRSVEQEEESRRERRFYGTSFVFFALWLVFWII